MDKPTEDALLREYDTCTHQVSRNEQAIWGSAGIFLVVNVVALASLLGREAVSKFIAVNYILLGVAAITILKLHRRLLSRLHFLNLAIYAREREIERQVKLRRGRYITALDAMTKSSKDELEGRLKEQDFEENELQEAVKTLNQTELLAHSGRRPKGIKLIQWLDLVLIVLWALFSISQLVALLGKWLQWSWVNSFFGVN